MKHILFGVILVTLVGIGGVVVTSGHSQVTVIVTILAEGVLAALTAVGIVKYETLYDHNQTVRNRMWRELMKSVSLPAARFYLETYGMTTFQLNQLAKQGGKIKDPLGQRIVLSFCEQHGWKPPE